MGLSPSKRVTQSFTSSPSFNSACDSVYEECLALTQHAFPGIRPYQLSSATDRLHHSLSSAVPLVNHWLPSPPSRSQIDNAYRIILSRRSRKTEPTEEKEDDDEESSLGPVEFKAFAVKVFSDAVVDNAGKAVLRRVPIGVAGIAGIGVATKSGKDLVGTAIGVYAVGVAASIYLSLAA